MAISPTLKPYLARVYGRWQRLSLASQFGVAAAGVIFCGMAIIGSWVSDRIETAVVQNTATAAALYMDSLLKPLLQELATGSELSEASQAKLDRLLTETPLGRRVVLVKVWGPNGLIVYSSRRELIGREFAETKSLKRAWSGQLGFEFEDLDDPENEWERSLDIPLLEIYAPVRDLTGNHRVIAVAEFYESATRLHAELLRARRESLLIVGLLSLAMLAVLFVIVRRGSRTIIRQQAALANRIQELSRLLARNAELRQRMNTVQRRSADIKESFLRRIGSDLHDGPTQLVSLALLKLDGLAHGAQAQQNQAHVEALHKVLGNCLKELREIASGLVLPEIDRMSPCAVLERAIANHEMRTGTNVERRIGELPADLPPAIKVAIYRFVQEGLTNAFRHAGGKGQKVEARETIGAFEVEVADRGPGMRARPRYRGDRGLGLIGLRDRIESLGGTFAVVSGPETGTSLRARFELAEVSQVAADCARLPADAGADGGSVG